MKNGDGTGPPFGTSSLETPDIRREIALEIPMPGVSRSSFPIRPGLGNKLPETPIGDIPGAKRSTDSASADGGVCGDSGH